MADGVFSRSVDRRRCRSVSREGRRCQLYVGHEDAHAHGWMDQRAAVQYYGKRPLPQPTLVVRWDESGEWSDDIETLKLPWCALHRD
jgi:hypothetical protein